MQVPLQISFHDVDHSDAVEQRIREKVSKLEEHYDHLTSCRVVVEKPHKHQHQGQVYNVRVDLTLPGQELVAHSGQDDHAHEDVYVAIRDVFESLHRQLKEHSQRNRRAQRAHRAASGE